MENPDEISATDPRADFIRMDFENFEKFCPIRKRKFSENHIRPPHLYSGVLFLCAAFGWGLFTVS
jgi:hypothetical protein